MKLAAGGLVSSPMDAVIGEGRETEAVMPLSELSGMVEQAGEVGAVRAQQSAQATAQRVSGAVEGGGIGEKLDQVVRELRRLDGDTTVEIDGDTLVTKYRDVEERRFNDREVSK